MMKKISSMHVFLLSLIFTCAIPLWAGAAVTGTEEALTVMEQGDVSYISGGVSDEEQQAIKEMGQTFNLKLVMAIQAGNYLSGTQVEILGPEGETMVEAVSDGPMFYADLPAGDYTVQVSGFGESYEKTVNVDPRHQVQLNFYWPNEAADKEATATE